MAQVLVVDDDRLIREQAREFLTRAGFEVTGLPDGREIFDRIRGNMVDVILLDIVLPEGSGLDILPLIKGLDPDLPVIIHHQDLHVPTPRAPPRPCPPR